MSSTTTPSKDIYYVPHSSIWPIVGSVALFVLAFGAVGLVNDMVFGPAAFAVGTTLVLIMMAGWF
jgi:hypothetical protein